MRVSNIKIIEDDVKSVACSGDDNTGAHPQVFLKLKDGQHSIQSY